MPIAEGHEGKVFAVALSPDGRLVAAGGWDASWSIDATNSVYVFEAATGRLVTRLGSLANIIDHLAFSPDGSRLAATLYGGQGMREWATAGWRLIAEDKDYGVNHALGAAFDRANNLFTVSYDGQVRRYGADGRLQAKEITQGGKEPNSVAVHPNGTKLAIGYLESTVVEVLDARTLKPLYAADTKGITGDDLSAVAWSADGARLYAGGKYSPPGGRRFLIWQYEGKGRRTEMPLAQNTIMHIVPCGDSMAVGSVDPAFGLLAPDGTKRVWQEGVNADIRAMGKQFVVAGDGKGLRFGLKPFGVDPLLLNLAAFRLLETADAPANYAPPKITGLDIKGWENTPSPTLNGKPITLDRYEYSEALAIAPDASRFVLGTVYWLRAYGADGKELWQKAVPSSAWGVNITKDGRLVVVAYGDGTIRWHRLSDGQELLALFVHAGDRRFVAWTPKGYYQASPGAEELIGWHVNRDWDHPADFFPASRFRDQFNRPDIVQRVLDTANEDLAIDQANGASMRKREDEDIKKRQPAVITILSPGQNGSFSARQLTVSYSVRSPSGLPLKNVRALIDGLPGRIGRRGDEGLRAGERRRAGPDADGWCARARFRAVAHCRGRRRGAERAIALAAEMGGHARRFGDQAEDVCAFGWGLAL